MEELSDQLPLRHGNAVDRSGVLTKRSGEVLNGLTTPRADLAPVMAQLKERVGGVRILGRVRELFLEQRDATGLAFQLGGSDRSIIEEAKFPED